eukprot:scaffold3016_cov415-Prasinococcus_capsulatus_cf.AAC.1
MAGSVLPRLRRSSAQPLPACCGWRTIAFTCVRSGLIGFAGLRYAQQREYWICGGGMNVCAAPVHLSVDADWELPYLYSVLRHAMGLRGQQGAVCRSRGTRGTAYTKVERQLLVLATRDVRDVNLQDLGARKEPREAHAMPEFTL